MSKWSDTRDDLTRGVNPVHLGEDIAHGHFSSLGAVLAPGLGYLMRGKHPANEAASKDGSDYASQTWANIARQDWENYKQNYQPVEDYLTSFVNNPQYNKQQIDKGLQQFNEHNQAAQGTTERNLKSYGLSLNPQQQQSYQRQANIQTGLGQVEAVNRTKRDLSDMQYAILGAGTRPQVEPTNAPQA